MTKENYHNAAVIADSGAASSLSHPISRRTALRTGALGGIGLATAGLSSPRVASAKSEKYPPLKGRINHAVVRWTFSKLSLDELCLAVKQIGFSAIALLRPHEWPTLKAHGVDCAMCLGPWGPSNFTVGFTTESLHDELEARYLKAIDLVADAGYRNLVCSAGSRLGRSDEEGLTAAETGLKRVLGYAEKRGVVLAMVMTNSREFPDYIFDNTAWGAALCKRLGSPSFRMIYDIYHMQMMEGNIIETISKYHEYIAYFHTGGVPNRCEIDDRQELNYTAICRAIAKTGFTGYFSQEYIPRGWKTKEDLIASLSEAIRICDV